MAYKKTSLNLSRSLDSKLTAMQEERGSDRSQTLRDLIDHGFSQQRILAELMKISAVLSKQVEATARIEARLEQFEVEAD